MSREHAAVFFVDSGVWASIVLLAGVCRRRLSSSVTLPDGGPAGCRERGNAAGGPAGRRPGAWAVGRPTLHGGPVVLRPVRATPCFFFIRTSPDSCGQACFPLCRLFDLRTVFCDGWMLVLCRWVRWRRCASPRSWRDRRRSRSTATWTATARTQASSTLSCWSRSTWWQPLVMCRRLTWTHVTVHAHWSSAATVSDSSFNTPLPFYLLAASDRALNPSLGPPVKSDIKENYAHI